MDRAQYLILINGQDKTDSVANYHFQNGMCEVVYIGSPKVYRYHSSKVQVLAVQHQIDPAGLIVVAEGNPIPPIETILDFGPFYPFLRTGGKHSLSPKNLWSSRRTALRIRSKRIHLNISKRQHRPSAWWQKMGKISYICNMSGSRVSAIQPCCPAIWTPVGSPPNTQRRRQLSIPSV